MIMKYTFLPFNISMLRSKCMFCTVGKKKRFQKSSHHASENTKFDYDKQNNVFSHVTTDLPPVRFFPSPRLYFEIQKSSCIILPQNLMDCLVMKNNTAPDH